MLRNIQVRCLNSEEKVTTPLCQWPLTDKQRDHLNELGWGYVPRDCDGRSEYLFSAEYWIRGGIRSVHQHIVCADHAAAFARNTGVSLPTTSEAAERPSGAGSPQKSEGV